MFGSHGPSVNLGSHRPHLRSDLFARLSVLASTCRCCRCWCCSIIGLCDKRDPADPAHGPRFRDGGPPPRRHRGFLLQPPLRRHVVLQHHHQVRSRARFKAFVVEPPRKRRVEHSEKKKRKNVRSTRWVCLICVKVKRHRPVLWMSARTCVVFKQDYRNAP